MKIKMRATVFPEFLDPRSESSIGATPVFRFGGVYDAVIDNYGNICAICNNGQKFILDSDDFRIVEEENA